MRTSCKSRKLVTMGLVHLTLYKTIDIYRSRLPYLEWIINNGGKKCFHPVPISLGKNIVTLMEILHGDPIFDGGAENLASVLWSPASWARWRKIDWFLIKSHLTLRFKFLGEFLFCLFNLRHECVPFSRAQRSCFRAGLIHFLGEETMTWIVIYYRYWTKKNGT